MRAVIYARYSSNKQREASIDDQVRECRKYAESNDLHIIGEYLDYEQSGRTDQRKQFQKMIADAPRGLFDRIIVYQLDRFARNRYDSANYKSKLLKHDIKVLSATEHLTDAPESVIMESVLEGMAEYYSLNLAKNTMRGKMGAALQCRHSGGTPLLGYKVLPDKTYAIDEDAAVAVRLIFEMYANGFSYVDIIETLNSRGFKTGSGRTFGTNSLHDLLKNERYIGVYTFNKAAAAKHGKRNMRKFKDESEIIRIEGGIPAIVDKNTFERVQKRMEENKKAPARTKANVNYLLTGKIFCGKCGGAMVGYPSTSKSGVYHYYSCCTKKRLRTCDMHNVKKEYVEDAVINYIRATLTDEHIENIANLAIKLQLDTSDQQREIKRMKKQLNEVNKALENIMTAIEQGIFTASTKDRISELEAQASDIRGAIGLAEFSTKTIYSQEDIVKFLKGVEGTEQQIINWILKAVYVFDDHLKIVCNFIDDVDEKVTLSDLEKSADLSGSAPSAPTGKPLKHHV